MQMFDVVILGSGQTGSRIARRLSQLPLRIALIALPHGAEDTLQRTVSALSEKPEQSDVSPIPERIVPMTATTSPHFLAEQRLSVNGEEVRFRFAVLANGCSPRRLSHIPEGVTPIEAFQQADGPQKATVWGGGALGVSTAMKLSKRNTAVRLVTRHPNLLPEADPTVSQFVTERLTKAGVEIIQETPTVGPSGFDVLCAGLVPNSSDLNLRAAFIYADATGRVKTDEQMRTSNPHVYAAGAVTGPPFHLGYEHFQADLVAENIQASFFMKHRAMPEPIATVIPFDPIVAWVGLTEPQALAKFKDAAAVSEPTGDGFVKLIAPKRSGVVVGVHLAGKGVDGLVLFFDLLIRAEIPLRDILDRHHFPTAELSSATARAVAKWSEIAGA